MIHIKDLQKMKPILNIRQLATDTGIPYDTLAQKIRKGTDLSSTQSENIESVLKDNYGIIFNREIEL